MRYLKYLPKYVYVLTFPLAFAAVFFSCDAFSDLKNCICTEEFKVYTVKVIDRNKRPLDSLRVRIYNPSTGRDFDIEQTYAPYESGVYVVMTDAYTHSLQEGGEAVIFEAENDTLSASGQFYFTTDDCRCHVEKISGPDTLMAAIKQKTLQFY